MGELTGKVAVVTGAGSGIGKGIALAFACAGAALVLASRNRASLERTAEEIRAQGGTADVVPTDVTDEAQVKALFARTLEVFRRLDILVNNSGVFDGGPLEELSLATWEKVMAVNVTGPFLCSREAMPILKRQGGGRILNVGSISAQMPRPNGAPYATSKHALVGLTKATALEGRAHGVVASCLHPGNVLTERRQASAAREDDEPMMSTAEIAKAALAMVALDPAVNMLEAIVLPVEQLYLGRG
jgi:NAD(P)-dependent dehydrogenase (short-subunit alcohol dehydrogenase family)